jgi:type IV secretory pathway TraG/TraD family ATPase VirD4
MPKTFRILILGLVVVVLVTGAAILGQYLGGLLFARLQKLPQDSVGVFTLFDYWQAYGDVPAVKRTLSVCTLLSAVIGCMPAAVITMALLRSRGRIAQFGNARFATRRDIVKAGLLEK